MLRNKCRTCGSGDLYLGRLLAQGGVMMGRGNNSFGGWKPVPVKSIVCVTCGGVEPYIEDAGIAKVKEWQAAESRETAGQAPGEGASHGPLIPVMIFLALVAILGAVIIPMLHIADKLK